MTAPLSSETQVEDLLDLLRIEREAKATANAEIALLRAEVEALKGALKDAEEALAPFSRCAEVGLPYSFTGADFVAAQEARNALLSVVIAQVEQEASR